MRDDCVKEAGHDLDDPLGALRSHFLFDVVERTERERPDDLNEEIVARAKPAIERHAIDVELVGEHAHVNTFRREKPALREAQRICSSGSGDHSHTCKDRMRVANAGEETTLVTTPELPARVLSACP